MSVPGNVSVGAAELYDVYIKDKPLNPLPKRTVGQLVSGIFGSIKVVHNNGKEKYRGLRPNFNSPEVCSQKTLDAIAANHGFVKVTETSGKLSYICFTEYTVNNHKQTKSVEISCDKAFQVKIGEIPVSLTDTGLQNMKISNTEDARIIFNTVKMAKVCRGKLVNKKCTSQRNMLQVWNKNGDENSSEFGLISKKCKGVVSFTSYVSTCTVCRNQVVTENKETEQPTCTQSVEDRMSLLRSLFPGCSEVMFKLLSAQSNICNSHMQDPRSRRWDKEIIQICLTLWNRSPQAYVSLVDSVVLVLPSISLLQKYKNCFEQIPGLNDNMLQWMFNEAKRLI